MGTVDAGKYSIFLIAILKLDALVCQKLHVLACQEQYHRRPHPESAWYLGWCAC